MRLKNLIGLLIVPLVFATSCVNDPDSTAIKYILGLAQSGELSGEVTFDNRILVYQEDADTLLGNIKAASDSSHKNKIVRNYIKATGEIACILDKIEVSVKEKVPINCNGEILVSVDNENRIPGVIGLDKAVQPLASVVSKRELLRSYVAQIEEADRINRVLESLGQIDRTHRIPLFGNVVEALHEFPILIDGQELVPADHIPVLLGEYRATGDRSALRDMVKNYLHQSVHGSGGCMGILDDALYDILYQRPVILLG